MYKIEIDKRAEKELRKIQKKDRIRILDAIQNLAANPRPKGCKKLFNRPGYRIRIGDFRVIYSIFDEKLIVIVIKIADRKEIYR